MIRSTELAHLLLLLLHMNTFNTEEFIALKNVFDYFMGFCKHLLHCDIRVHLGKYLIDN